MIRTRKRQAAFQALFWVQVVLLILMLVFGGIYAIGLFLNLSSVSGVIYPIALQLALALRIMLYAVIGFVIVLGYYRRLSRRKKTIDQGLKDRLRLVVSQTEQRMMIKKPVRPLILPRGANAANIGRNRIIVGEKLVQHMDDQELAGIIGHELAHGIQHHVLIKAVLFPLVIVLGLALYVITWSSPGGTLLVWTIFAGIIFAEVPLSWKMEYSADHRSAELLGKVAMTRALAYLKEIHYDGPSFTHPRFSSRINRLAGNRNLQEVVADVPISPVTPFVSIGGRAPESRVSVEKSKPVGFPSYVYEAAKPRVCPICGVQVPAGKLKCGACGTTLKP